MLMKLGGLWHSDIETLRRKGVLIDYGLEKDNYHYWAIVRIRR